MTGRKRPVLDLAPSAGFEQDHAAVMNEMLRNEFREMTREQKISYLRKRDPNWRVVALGVRLDFARICVDIRKKLREGKNK